MGEVRHIAPEMLRELLDYDPETGVLTWRERPASYFAESWKAGGWNARYAGTRAGTLTANGYTLISVYKKRLLAHRVAWAVHYGEWPSMDLDHVNQNKTDNRLSNLRLATRSDNEGNTKTPKHNISGFKGVSWASRSRKWLARIVRHGHAYHLGLYDDPAEAATAYARAAEKLFGEFACADRR